MKDDKPDFSELSLTLQFKGPVIERSELHCHECNQYVQFNLDVSINGNHVLNCPNCGHEHCRVVKDGKVSDTRWASRNRNDNFTINIIVVTGATATSTSMTTWANGGDNSTGVSTNQFLYSAWANTVTGS